MNRYIVKGWFSNGSSEGGADTIDAALATWKRIICSHGDDPFLERVEIWESHHINGLNMIAVCDMAGVKELTPALEELIEWRGHQARGREILSQRRKALSH